MKFRTLIAAMAMITLLASSACGYNKNDLEANARAAEGYNAANTFTGFPTPEPGSSPTFAVFIGDSFTAGTGAPEPRDRWIALLSDGMGWTEENLGASGTGYLSRSEAYPCPKCRTFGETIVASKRWGVGYVVISGGINDRGADPAEFRDAVSGTLTAAKETYPDARIIVLNPHTMPHVSPDELAPLTSIIEEEAAASGATYVDIGAPLADDPELRIPDGHPNPAGHREIAGAVQGALMSAGIKP